MSRAAQRNRTARRHKLAGADDEVPNLRRAPPSRARRSPRRVHSGSTKPWPCYGTRSRRGAVRPAPRLEAITPDTVETITPAGEEDPVGVFGGAHGGRRVMFVVGELARAASYVERPAQCDQGDPRRGGRPRPRQPPCRHLAATNRTGRYCSYPRPPRADHLGTLTRVPVFGAPLNNGALPLNATVVIEPSPEGGVVHGRGNREKQPACCPHPSSPHAPACWYRGDRAGRPRTRCRAGAARQLILRATP